MASGKQKISDYPVVDSLSGFKGIGIKEDDEGNVVTAVVDYTMVEERLDDATKAAAKSATAAESSEKAAGESAAKLQEMVESVTIPSEAAVNAAKEAAASAAEAKESQTNTAKIAADGKTAIDESIAKANSSLSGMVTSANNSANAASSSATAAANSATQAASSASTANTAAQNASQYRNNALQYATSAADSANNAGIALAATKESANAAATSAKEAEASKLTTENSVASIQKYIKEQGVNITNNPDEEDLSVDNDNKLKFADRTYDSASASGLGCVILRKNWVDGKNVLTQDMMSAANTVYEIRYDFDLNGQTITVPSGCVLDFKGGKLANGSIIVNDSISISAPRVQVFDGIDFTGSASNSIPELQIEWIGCKANDATFDNSSILRNYVNCEAICGFKGESKYYFASQIDITAENVSIDIHEIQVVTTDDFVLFNVLKGYFHLKSDLIYNSNTKDIESESEAYSMTGTAIKCSGNSYNCDYHIGSIRWFKRGIWLAPVDEADESSYAGVQYCKFYLGYMCNSYNIEIQRDAKDRWINNNYFYMERLSGGTGIYAHAADSVDNTAINMNHFYDCGFEGIWCAIDMTKTTATTFENVRMSESLKGNYWVKAKNCADLRIERYVTKWEDTSKFSISDCSGWIGGSCSAASKGIKYLLAGDTIILDEAPNYARGTFWYGECYIGDSGLSLTWNEFLALQNSRRNSSPESPIIRVYTDYTVNVSIPAYGVRNCTIMILKVTSGAGIVFTDASGNSLTVRRGDMYAISATVDGTLWYMRLDNYISGATSWRPTDNLIKGMQYFDTTLAKPIWWTGSAWVDATGTEV